MPASFSTRREMMRRSVALLAVAACDPGSVAKEEEPGDTFAPAPPVAEPITTNEDFYITTYSTTPAEDWADAWTLTIAGVEPAEVVLDLAGLKALGEVELEWTLECIGNSSAYAISNALWRGIDVRDLLSKLGLSIPSGATHLQFESGDAYVENVPLTDLEKGLFLVWTMNGAALPLEHGFPVRVLTPGRYGMKNPKWLVKIGFTDSPDAGTWEARGWSNDCTYKIHSWIQSPSYNQRVDPAGFEVSGCAFAGLSGISRVELSDDAGKSWTEVEITYPGGPGVWTLWRTTWVPRAEGDLTLQVRATDGNGVVQEDKETYDENLDGWEGIHEAPVQVG